jgi:hypothetical protein
MREINNLYYGKNILNYRGEITMNKMMDLLKNKEVQENIINGVKVSGSIVKDIAITYVKVSAIVATTFVAIGTASNICESIKDKRTKRKENKKNNVLETNELEINLDDLTINVKKK